MSGIGSTDVVAPDPFDGAIYQTERFRLVPILTEPQTSIVNDPSSIPAYLRAPHENLFWAYFLASKNREALYIGVTNDLAKRLREHRNPSPGSTAFTTRYHTTDLVYYEPFDGAEVAIAREKQLKAWRREKKDALVNRMNPKWEDLSWKFERELPAYNDGAGGE